MKPWNKGKKMSEESKEKLSKKAKLRWASGVYTEESRFKMGATFRGKKLTEEHKKKLSESVMAEKNHNWKGDSVGYSALHDWLIERISKPNLCPDCNKRPPYDLTNLNGKYTRNLANWRWRCRKCHMVSDGRLDALHEGNKKILENTDRKFSLKVEVDG